MAKKSGANFSDRKQIRAMADRGGTAKGIATVLGLPIKCVKSFMPIDAASVKVAKPDSVEMKIPGLPGVET